MKVCRDAELADDGERDDWAWRGGWRRKSDGDRRDAEAGQAADEDEQHDRESATEAQDDDGGERHGRELHQAVETGMECGSRG